MANPYEMKRNIDLGLTQDIAPFVPSSDIKVSETIPDAKEEEPTLEELEETGKRIDEQYEYQTWLKENKKVLSDNKYILYRLPLTHDQRENVYQSLLKDAKNNKSNVNI